MKNILVTGGAGFIGSQVVRDLLEKGLNPVIYDNLTTGYSQNLEGLPVTLIRADVRDRVPLSVAMKDHKIHGVIHLAASVGNKRSIDDPYFDAGNNYMGVLNILEAMREHGVKTIVFSSSAGIFGEPQYQPVDEKHPCEPDSPYGVSKLGGEKLILTYARLYNLKAVSLRYFNVFGPRQRFDNYGNVIPIFLKKAMNGEDLTIFGDGEQTRDFVSVRDVAAANVAAVTGDYSGVVNVGTGQEISVNALAKTIVGLAGGKSKIHHAENRPGDVRHCTAKVEVLKNQLGVQPRLNFDELLEECYRWMKADKLDPMMNP